MGVQIKASSVESWRHGNGEGSVNTKLSMNGHRNFLVVPPIFLPPPAAPSVGMPTLDLIGHPSTDRSSTLSDQFLDSVIKRLLVTNNRDLTT